MTTHIIAICGLKRSGKDTVADYICSKYGYRKMKFADPLKNALRSLFNFTEEQMEDDKKDQVDEKWGITPRNALQFFGTEVMQYKLQELLPSIGRTFWAERLFSDYGTAHPKHNIVISDMRFPHELDVIKRYGGNITVMRVDRSSCTSSKDSALQHSSENEFRTIPVDVVIENDTSIKNLLDQVDVVMVNRT